jgi:hypothetical protein
MMLGPLTDGVLRDGGPNTLAERLSEADEAVVCVAETRPFARTRHASQYLRQKTASCRFCDGSLASANFTNVVVILTT